MTTKNKIIFIVIAAGYILLAILFRPTTTKPVPKRYIKLTDTDTIYKEIQVLKLKSDTIKIKYETKINHYRRSSTTNKIQLFADRINR